MVSYLFPLELSLLLLVKLWLWSLILVNWNLLLNHLHLLLLWLNHLLLLNWIFHSLWHYLYYWLNKLLLLLLFYNSLSLNLLSLLQTNISLTCLNNLLSLFIESISCHDILLRNLPNALITNLLFHWNHLLLLRSDLLINWLLLKMVLRFSVTNLLLILNKRLLYVLWLLLLSLVNDRRIVSILSVRILLRKISLLLGRLLKVLRILVILIMTCVLSLN